MNDLIEALPEVTGLELIDKPYHDRFYAELKRLAFGQKVPWKRIESPELPRQALTEGTACSTRPPVRPFQHVRSRRGWETGFVGPRNNPDARFRRTGSERLLARLLHLGENR